MEMDVYFDEPIKYDVLEKDENLYVRYTRDYEAKGKYLFFVDSDDVIHPRLLSALYRGMEESGAALGGSGIRSVPDSKWEKIYPHMESQTGEGQTEFLSHEDTVHAVFRSVTPLNLIGGVMMRRDLIGDTRFATDLFIGEDFWFIYQNLIKGASAALLKERWYYCRHHESNISNNSWSRRVPDSNFCIIRCLCPSCSPAIFAFPILLFLTL